MTKLIEISANNITDFSVRAVAAGIPRDLVSQVLEDILSGDHKEDEPIVGVFIDIAKEPTQVIGASTKPDVRFGDLLHSLFDSVAPTSILDGASSNGAIALAHALASRPKEQEFVGFTAVGHIVNVAADLRDTLLLDREDSLLLEALSKTTGDEDAVALIIDAHEASKASSLLLVTLDYLLNTGYPHEAVTLFLENFGWTVDTGK